MSGTDVQRVCTGAGDGVCVRGIGAAGAVVVQGRGVLHQCDDRPAARRESQAEQLRRRPG
eukprot:776712-Rhodomonas_salina.1